MGGVQSDLSGLARLPKVRVTPGYELAVARDDLAAAHRQIAQLRAALLARDATVADLRVKVAALMSHLPPELPVEVRRPMLVIATEVAWVFAVDLAEMRGDRRLARLIPARHRAMRMMHDAGWSMPQIARFFGKKDHTCVVHAKAADAARIAAGVA